MKSRKTVYYVLAAAVLIAIGAIGYAMWRDSRTNTLEINIGDETILIETQGG
ncbi:MAG: hypothetical protein KIS81_01155 [Maricaulaceae bacterium]|nr:hypothetical protein [Maricaulaceae bacterium]